MTCSWEIFPDTNMNEQNPNSQLENWRLVCRTSCAAGTSVLSFRESLLGDLFIARLV